MTNQEWEQYKADVRFSNAEKIRAALMEQPHSVKELSQRLNLSRYAVENAMAAMRRKGEFHSIRGMGREVRYQLTDDSKEKISTVRRYLMKDDVPFKVREEGLSVVRRDPLVAALFGGHE